MNKKHKIIFGAICTINFVASLLLLIFLIPKNVPILIDAKEAITHLGSKWIMMIFAIIPLILITFLFINNKKTKFFIKILIILSLFEYITLNW